MKKANGNSKKVVMMALTLSLISTPFMSNSIKANTEIVVVGPEAIKDINLALLKIIKNIQGLREATHSLLSKGHKTTRGAAMKKIVTLQKEMNAIAQDLPSGNELFTGVKNMARHFASAQDTLHKALKTNQVKNLVEAMNSINTTSIGALENEIYGPNGLFVQFGKLEDKVLAELLQQLTAEVDKLTQMDPAALGHSNVQALALFMVSKERGFKGDGLLQLQQNGGMAPPRKLAR